MSTTYVSRSTERADTQTIPAVVPERPRSHRPPNRAAGIIFVLLIPILVTAGYVWSKQGDDGQTPTLDVTITGCTVTSTDATVMFQVSNYGSLPQQQGLRWDFRDSRGAVVASASTSVTVPPTGTVRGSQTTLIKAEGVSGGTCNVGA